MNTQHEPTEHEQIQPTKGLRGLKLAHLLGSNGEQLPHGSTLPQRVAHKIGRGHFEAGQALNEQYKREQEENFAETLDVAKGLNADALLIFQAGMRLKDKQYPLAGQNEKDRIDGPVHTITRNVLLGHGKNAIELADELPPIAIDNLKWSAAQPYNITVRNLSITTRASQSREGNPTGVETTIFVNDSSYSPEEQLEESSRIKNGMKVVIDSSGEVTYIGLPRGNRSGYTDEDPKLMQVNLEEFLTRVKELVDRTVEAKEAA